MANHTVAQSSSSLELVQGLLRGTSPLVLFLIVPVITVFFWTLATYFSSPLRKYPGPLLASKPHPSFQASFPFASVITAISQDGFTRLWYLYEASTGDSHLTLDKLHRKYGPIVRITPNIIDIDYPEMIKSIFNTKGDWLKTPFYHGSSALVNGQIVYNLFSQTDPSKHAKERKPVAKYFSSSAMTTMEPHIDKVANQLCHELETRFIDGPKSGQAFDLGQWILYYTWDVVGSITFSQPIGYLEKGYDFDGTLSNADKAMDYFTIVGTMPFLDHVFDKNPYYRMGPPGFNTITGISVQHLIDRYQGNDKDYHDPENPDFLDRFIEAKNADPENIDDGQIISWLMVNMIAGADTTAITIRSALYFSLKHPQVWARLTKEILAAGFRNTIPPAYKEAKALPYVDAVVREALRMLPGVSMTMERYVPQGGYSLPNGDFLPQGTIVGMSPYILARNKFVYGEDADEFRPERWLQDVAGGESPEDFQKRLLMMNQADLSFGGGSRVCIGKNMGLFQTYKVLTSLVTLYEIELADPKKEWKVTNSWFPRQEGLEVKMKRRI
ncbi:Fc.00g045070.m01.CDS01 [Cosmosporella sp. VM-42]